MNSRNFMLIPWIGIPYHSYPLRVILKCTVCLLFPLLVFHCFYNFVAVPQAMIFLLDSLIYSVTVRKFYFVPSTVWTSFFSISAHRVAVSLFFFKFLYNSISVFALLSVSSSLLLMFLLSCSHLYSFTWSLLSSSSFYYVIPNTLCSVRLTSSHVCEISLHSSAMQWIIIREIRHILENPTFAAFSLRSLHPYCCIWGKNRPPLFLILGYFSN